eukprot:619094_1
MQTTPDKLQQQQQLNDSAPKDAPNNYNTDEKGWALIETYIWDIGEDEEIEQLIDKALRILLIHPAFDTLLWKNKDAIQNLYADGTFGDIVSQIHGILFKITEAMVVAKIENTSALKSMKGTLSGMVKHIAAQSELNETEIDATVNATEEEEEMKNMSASDLYNFGDKEQRASDYAFWNISVYKDLKDAFGIDNKAKETYLWSFLVAIACCIKYLEIEINAMPQFDIQKSTKKRDEKKQVIWKGFIVPPTHGTVGVNKLDDEKEIEHEVTQYVPLVINKTKTVLVRSGTDHCTGCFVPLTEINWRKHGKPYCPQCIKFRVYQECVRKFVLEFDNEETVDDLWPWYENSKNQMDLRDYKLTLDMFSDEVLQIDSILESNLKYYIPREKTLEAQETLIQAEGSLQTPEEGSDKHDKMKDLLLKAQKPFQPYRNIRYLRKFSAMFLLGEREIWKDLLKLKKWLKHEKKLRLGTHVQSSSNDSFTPDDKPGLANVISQDKSVVDDDKDFKISFDDRIHLNRLLREETIAKLLYGKPKDLSIEEIQQKILRRNDEFVQPELEERKSALSGALNEVWTAGKFARKQSDAVMNQNLCRAGVENFLQIWSRLPHWWKPIHDQTLLELALMHRLDVSQYAEALDDEEYYESLERFNYKAFEYWCSKAVNVQHRLRFLLFVIDNDKYPESMIFMNDIMKNSHLFSFNKTMAEKQKSRDSMRRPISRGISRLLSFDGAEDDEQPVRHVTREFRDIVQILEPEALGVRIWRFIMNQLASKQRKSLWAALTILAEELPSNMVLSLLEADRDMLRRGNPKYLNAVCQSVIKGSNYPTATALHLARYMEQNATDDLARTEIWQQFCDDYEDIAIHLINQIESDHLLAMLLEIPTDIQQKTIIEMAVLYRRLRFVNSARVQGVMTHMWSESEFLNPNKPVRTTDLDMHELYKLLWVSPVRFYYCPLGLYATTAVLYIVYLMLVSYISYKNIYPYTPYDLFSLETLMWVCNAGYIIYEGLELEQKRAQYFAMDSMINVLDTWIVINWVVLFVMRIGAIGFAPDVTDRDAGWCDPVCDGREMPYVGPDRTDPTIDVWAVNNGTDTEMSLLERRDPLKRNERYTIVFMAFWGIQLIVLWIRIVGLLQRTEILGPLLTMLVRVLKDVTSFLILVMAITCGFLFAVHYIVGGDIDRDVQCDLSYTRDEVDICIEVSQAINSVRGIALYLVQALLGQQDWNVMDSNPLYGFARGRAQLLTLIVLAYILMGGIISMNLLIAIMSTSFDLLHDQTQAQLAFLRVESTYDLAHRGRLMPPPFNVFVVAVWALIMVINVLIKACSCGSCKLGLDGINPYYIVCLRRGNQHGDSSIIKRDNPYVEKGKGYSASKETKKIGKQLRSDTLREQLDVLKLFESIDSVADDTKKHYCKHCYCRMRDIKDGKVENYFKFFEFGREENNSSSSQSFGLDKDDMRMIKRLFRYCSLCPQCYRPFGIWTESSGDASGGASDESLGELGTDRYDRHHVLMDVISCYFFLLLVWIPLMIILAIPALFSNLFDKVSKSEQTGYAANKQLDAGAFGDYHPGVEQQTVKHLVDKRYGGSTVFVDDEEGGEDSGDDRGDEAGNEHMQQLLFEIGEKVNMIQDPTYKRKDLNASKKKTTTMQLEKKQRKLKADKEKKRLDAAVVEMEENNQQNVELASEDEKDDAPLVAMFHDDDPLTAIKKKISSAKDVGKLSNSQKTMIVVTNTKDQEEQVETTVIEEEQEVQDNNDDADAAP